MNELGLIVRILVLDALGAGCLIAGIALAHTETVEAHHGFLLAQLGGAFFLLSIVTVHLLVLRKAGWVVALISAVAVLGGLAFAASQTPLFRLPFINDISTDLESPPPLAVSLHGEPPAAPPYPPAFIPQVRAAYPDLKALEVTRAPAEVLAKIAAALKAMPGIEQVRVDEAAGLVHAVEVTPLMRFRDDFTLRAKAQGAVTRVDMRSRSRVGKSDVGANAARIRRVLAVLELALH